MNKDSADTSVDTSTASSLFDNKLEETAQLEHVELYCNPEEHSLKESSASPASIKSEPKKGGCSGQKVFLIVITAFCIYFCIAFKDFIDLCNLFTEWLDTHPWEAPFGIILMYTVLLPIGVPLITYTAILFGFSLQHSYHSYTYTFLVGGTAMYIGVLTSSAIMFVLGRHCFRGMVTSYVQ